MSDTIPDYSQGPADHDNSTTKSGRSAKFVPSDVNPQINDMKEIASPAESREHDLELSDILKIGDKPQVLLKKLLSTKFAFAGPSLFVKQYNESLKSNTQGDAQMKKKPLLVRAIGWGSCGVVYKPIGTHIIKRAIKGNTALAEECRLFNDWVMHQKIEQAFASVADTDSSYEFPVQVPQLYNFMKRRDKLCWTTTADLFEDGDRTPEDLLFAERIPPVNIVARHALIELYCPEELKAGARIQDSNDDCLVRLYLGKRRDLTARLRPRCYFGLQNFPLCLDQMQELGLDTTAFASAMAQALAVMHWKAKIDAADVEFVLGGKPSHLHVTSATAHFGATHIWLLDFNQCQPMQMNERGIDQAVKRFFDNDPYYPRPPQASSSDDDKALWQIFVNMYIKVSGDLVSNEHEHLPALFIDQVRHGMTVRTNAKAKAAERSDSYSEFDRAAHGRD